MTRNFPPPTDLAAQQILDLITERSDLPEKDLQFAITQILNGNGNGHNVNGRTTDAGRLQQQEIFDSQPPELQEFMLQTALLPQLEMTPRFCNALLKIDHAEAHLQAMADHNLLGNPPFSEFLRHKVKQDEAAYQKLCLKTANTLHSQIQSQKAIGLFVQAQEWPKAAELLKNYGQELYDKGRALDLYGWLEQIPESNLARHPRLLLLKGRILNDDLARYSEAITCYVHAEPLFEQQNDLVGITEARILQSASFRMMGEASRAIDLANEGLDKLNNELLIAPARVTAWATRNRGLAYGIVGQISESLADLYQSLTLFEKIGNAYYIAMCHHDIGVSLEKQAKIGGAEYHYEKAVRVWRQLGNQNDLANSLNSLGSLLYLTGRYDEALNKFNACAQIAKKIGAPRRQAFAWAGIADVYRARQKYQKAIRIYSQSSKFARAAKVQHLQVYNILKTGEILFAQNHLEKALKLAKQAADIADRNGLATEYGMAIALWAKIYMLKGWPFADLFDKAIDHLEGNALEQAKVKLWLAYGLLFHASRAGAAFKQFRAVVSFFMATDKLALVVAEPLSLFVHFLHRAGTPPQVVDDIELLLKNSKAPQETARPGWQMFAFGQPYMVVDDKRYDFSSRGIVGRTAEFLLYLILVGRGRNSFLSEQICGVLWPGVELEKARSYFKQIVKRLRNVNFKGTDYIEREGFRYRLNKNYYCDVLAFERLFEKASRLPPAEALPWRREILSLYRGDFLAGFELSEWGEAYRAELRQKYLQTVELVEGAKQ